ncbi:MAG: radical SAM protein [Myxococcota bacterium]
MSRTDLKVGFACNNRCVFCAQGSKRERAPAIGRANLRNALADGRRTSDSLVVTGGEPTVRRDLCDLVAEARAIGYRRVQIQTNGRMLAYRGLCEALLRAGATEFSPALHGDTAELHDALTGAPKSFAQTVAGIRNLVALGARVLSNTVVVRPNVARLPAVATLLCDLGVAQYQLAYVHPVGTAAERFDEVVPRPRDLVPWLHDALDVGRRRGVPSYAEAVPLCLLRGREWAASEAIMPRTVVFDLGRVVDFEAYRHGEGKAHGPQCARCTWLDRCEGPWRETPERFGWQDFEPRSD